MIHLPATLLGNAPAIDPAGVLQLLESQRANGTFRLGDHALRLRAGRVAKASGEPLETLRAILSSSGTFRFRAVPFEFISGPLALGITGLLLEAARLSDESLKS